MDINFLPILATVVFLLLAVFIISFALLFQKRQIQNLRNLQAIKIAYEQEILKAQLEIQNTTLQRIGEELHDNIGQILSVARINLNILEETGLNSKDQNHVLQANEMVEQALRDLRDLTKSLDSGFVQDFGLEESISHELERLRKTKRFETRLTVQGKSYSLGHEKEIVLFRIVQEIINNAIKHSEAHNLIVTLNYSLSAFNLTFSDDGVGFDWTTSLQNELSKSGAGLRNIQRRASLIGGSCEFKSVIGQGTTVFISIPNLEVSNKN